MEIKINSWKAVSYWKWKVDNDNICGICRGKYEQCCPDCKLPGDDCCLLHGECSHVYHLHCIEKWLQKDGTCPMDRKAWVTKN
jgi:anaphase-promoting complex subunit 11